MERFGGIMNAMFGKLCGLGLEQMFRRKGKMLTRYEWDAGESQWIGEG